MKTIKMPKINGNEIYAGIVTWNNGNPKHHIILIREESSDNVHAKQSEWAFNLGGDLPMRDEMLILQANCKSIFNPKKHYWTGERNARFSRFFWMHNFGSSISTMCDGLTVKGSAFAVRRMSIENSKKCFFFYNA